MDIENFKNKILNLVIIIISIIISVNIYTKQIKQIDLLKSEKGLEAEKNEILKHIIELQSKNKLYKDYVNKKDISSVINTFISMAKVSGVVIISIKPDTEETVNNTFVKYPFTLQVNSDTYEAIGKFISMIESNPEIYFIDSIDITSQKTTEVVRGKPKLQLNLSMSVSTILLK